MKKTIIFCSMLLFCALSIPLNATGGSNGGSSSGAVGPGLSGEYKGTCKPKLGSQTEFVCVDLSGTKNCDSDSDCILV